MSLRQPELEYRNQGVEKLVKWSKQLKWETSFGLLDIPVILTPASMGYRRITRALAKALFYVLLWMPAQPVLLILHRTLSPFLYACLRAVPMAILHFLALSGMLDLLMGALALTLLANKELYMLDCFHFPRWNCSIREFWKQHWHTGPTRIAASIVPLCVPAEEVPTTSRWLVEPFLGVPSGVLCQGLLYIYISLTTQGSCSLPLIGFFIIHALACWTQTLLEGSGSSDASVQPLPGEGLTDTPPSETLAQRLPSVLLSAGVVAFVTLPLFV